MSPTTAPGVPDLKPGSRPALPSLTGLRIFAALGVFLLHSLMLADPLKPQVPMSYFADQRIARLLATFVGKAGFIGVSFFFLLSGFLLTWSIRPGQTTWVFIRRRLVKIFPNHIVMWAVAMVSIAGVTASLFTPLVNLLLLHAWFQDPKTFISVNSPSWSLCCELLFYLSFPWLIRGVGRIADKRLWAWAAAMVAGTVAISIVNFLLVPDHPRSKLLPMAVPQQWFGYIFPLPRLFEFVLGMLLARIVAAGLWPRIRTSGAVALALIGYVVTIWVPSPFDFTVAMLLPLSVLIATVAAADLRGDRTGLRSRPMQWLGNVSFGFYLSQGVMLFQVRLWLGGDHTYSAPVAVLLWLTLFALTLTVGAVLYHLVEDPIFKRFATARKSRPTAAAVPARESVEQAAVS